MKLKRVHFCVIVFAFILMASTWKAGARNNPQPAIYNIERLRELRQIYLTDAHSLIKFLSDADNLVNAVPVSVLEKNKSFANNSHFYCSISRYAWPREDNSSVYIIKDGMTNPEYEDFDLPKLEIFRDRLKILSVAYYVTQDKKYYNSFLNHVNVWFLNKSSYMKPNMDYAQVQPGTNDNKGMPYGLVELNRFTPILESIFLVQSVNDLDRKTKKGLKRWFKDMLKWTLSSNQWAEESKGTNNVVASLYVTLIEMARYTEDTKIIRRLSREYKERVLDNQIDDEGKQPAELKRTIGYGYSVSNLNNIVDFCLIMEKTGIYFYEENQHKIDNAFEYLLQFEENHDAFPYQQITGWEHYEKMLNRNASRLTRMTSHNKKMEGKSISLKDSDIQSIMEYVY